MKASERAPTSRLGIGVYPDGRDYGAPWQKPWKITMGGDMLAELSAELLSLPDPLPPRLHQLRRLAERAVATGHADWEHGLHPASMRTAPDPAWEPGDPWRAEP